MSIFNKLKKAYFGDRPVSGIVEDPTRSRVIITFADDKLPKTEDVHTTEWEDGQSEKPCEKPHEKQEWFVKRTHKMRQAILDTAISFNPRFADVKKIIGWIDEGLNMTYRSVLSKVYGVENFDTDATVDLVFSKHKDLEEEIKDWTEFEKGILEQLRKNGTKIHEITSQSLFGSIQHKMENVISRAVASALGGSDESRRCSDMEKLLKS